MADSVQRDNTVHGDQAGRDIHKTILPARAPTIISSLHATLREEARVDPEIQKLIDRLQHYAESIDTDPIGLEQKLVNGGRENWFEHAKRLKEAFAKRLLLNNLSSIGQEILVYALARTDQLFWYYVDPKVKAGEDDATIRKSIVEDVVSRVIVELEENLLRLMPDEVEGMVWFLTGTCYIKWTR